MEKEYYYYVDSRKRNTNDEWKRLKISNKTFQDNFLTHYLIIELNNQDKEYEYQNQNIKNKVNAKLSYSLFAKWDWKIKM